MPVTERFIVKICGVTTKADAQAALDAGANALGFNFWPKSKRYIPVAQAAEIAADLLGSYLRVGVFVNPSEDELLSAAAAVPLDVLQLHGRNAKLPAGATYRIWQAVPGGSQIEKDSRVEAYLLDSVTPEHGGSGKTFDWSLAAGLEQRAIIAGGLDSGNVAEAIQIACPWGVDACSRIERAPGLKDHLRMRAFIEAALAASNSRLVPEMKI